MLIGIDQNQKPEENQNHICHLESDQVDLYSNSPEEEPQFFYASVQQANW